MPTTKFLANDIINLMTNVVMKRKFCFKCREIQRSQKIQLVYEVQTNKYPKKIDDLLSDLNRVEPVHLRGDGRNKPLLKIGKRGNKVFLNKKIRFLSIAINLTVYSISTLKYFQWLMMHCIIFISRRITMIFLNSWNKIFAFQESEKKIS